MMRREHAAHPAEIFMAARDGDAVEISVVIPIFNEAASIAVLHERLIRTLESVSRSFEVWYVDDGSSDGSAEMLKQISAGDARVGVVELSRNFGQHAALLAGFSVSRGATVVTLDG